MLHWIKRWRDWAMRDIREFFAAMQRTGMPRLEAIHFSYEKAGILVRNEPIPWNADAVLVEAMIRFPANVARRKTAFTLRYPGQPQLAASSLHRHSDTDLFRLQFRLPPPRQSLDVQVHWNSRQLGHCVLPLLTLEQFIEGLRVDNATVFVRLGEYTVPCQAFLASQCKGLMATAVLNSPTSLAPLLDLDLAVEFIDTRTKEVQVAPVRLIAPQLSTNQALVTVAAMRRPRRIGVWAVQWKLSGRSLARSEVRIVSQNSFRRSLYMADTRYVVIEKEGSPTLTRHLPALGEHSRLGPCFLIGSREPGMAALCPLEVRVQSRGGSHSVLLAQEMLVTDGPTLFTPGTVGPNDLQQIAAFELYHRTQMLGLLSTSPAPVASFTSEGGYRPPEDYGWSNASEEELGDRLARLSELSLE
jgi:hypothetical protein